MTIRFWLTVIAIMIFPAAFADAAFAKRVALLIANSNYTNASALKNPGSDARLIAASLKRAGFETVEVRNDLGKAQLDAALASFGQKAEGADVALIYYSGHGIEAGGQNYLIPTDARLVRDRDLEVEATRLDTLLLMSEPARMRIIVLDACRNNPFTASMQRTFRTRAVGRGLAAVEPEGETLVVYAAKAGATASDGEGNNSPFAEAFAKRVTQPGLEISLLFRAVRDDVLTTTGRVQEPFTYGSLSGNAFYFIPGGKTAQQPAGNQAAPPPMQVQAAPVVSSETSEALYWQGTMSANTEGAFREYLNRYPKGQYAVIARENLQRFKAPKQMQPAPQAAAPQASGGGGMFGSLFSIPNMASGFSKPAQPAPSAGADPAAQFAFAPNRSIRQQTTNEFVSQMTTMNAQFGTIMQGMFATNDVFSAVNKEIAKYGLTTNNTADAFALMIDSFRELAVIRNPEPDATRAQAQAVRRQAAGILLLSPGGGSMSEVEKQKLSDQMVLITIFLATMTEIAKNAGQAELYQLSDLIAEEGKKSFGMDFRAMKLTPNGWTF